MAVTLIPIKSLAQAKSRLQHRLSAEERAQLMHDTLRHTVRALQQSGCVSRVVLVTRDSAVTTWATEWGIESFAESEQSTGLNTALEEARLHCCADSDTRVSDTLISDALLVLPGDVAWLEPDDVRGMVALVDGTQGPCAVIAPDRHRRGTNALLLRPPALIPFQFGPDSAQRHADTAQSVGAQIHWYHSSSISLDVDEPNDLRLYEHAAFWLEME